jgi:hypothetical protein
MAKGSRGGKRAAGSRIDNSEKITDQFKRARTVFNPDTENLSGVKLENGLQGVSDTLDAFGIDKGTITLIKTHNDSNTSADMALDGVLSFNSKRKYYGKGSDDFNINDNPELGMNVVNGTSYGVGVHEGGHHVVNKAFESYRDSANLGLNEYFTGQGKFANKVVRDAQKQIGAKSKPKISGYASTNSSEYVAEAISDFVINKGKAQPISNAIANILKGYL